MISEKGRGGKEVSVVLLFAEVTNDGDNNRLPDVFREDTSFFVNQETLHPPTS